MRLPFRSGKRNRRRGGLLSRLIPRRRARSRVDDVAVGGAPSAAAAEAAANVPQTPPSRNRRRSNPVWTLLAWLLPVAAAVVAFASPFLGARAYEYLMQSGHFYVRQLVISGNDHLDTDQVRRLAGVEPGTHVLSADLDRMEARLEAHDWVARARVTRELPDRIAVRVDEHRAAAYLASPDGLLLVDVAGEPFTRVAPGDDLDVPIVTGVSLEAFEEAADAAVARADLRAAVNLTRLYGSMELAERWPVAEVRVEPGRRLTLVLSESGTEAVLGQGPYRHKLYRLEWVLEKLHQEGKVADYVLLDSWGPSLRGEDDGRVVVRADLAPTGDDLAAAASERARAAMERLLPGDMVGPPAPEGLIEDAGDDEDEEEPQGGPARVSPGVRPAAPPPPLADDDRAGPPWPAGAPTQH
ncbi:MAG: cell division protein FtsQ/DivIB [Myxococcota bacterium]